MQEQIRQLQQQVGQQQLQQKQENIKYAVDYTVNTGVSLYLNITGFVLSLVSFFLAWTGIICWIFAVPALIISIIGINKSKQMERPYGLGTAGLIISIVSIFISFILILIGILFVSSWIDYFNNFKF